MIVKQQDIDFIKNSKFFRLNKLLRGFNSFMNDKFLGLSITPKQFIILAFVEFSEVTTLIIVGKEIGMDRTSAQRNVGLLEERGFIKKEKIAGRKKSGLKITKKGEDILKQTLELYKKSEGSFDFNL